MRRLPSLTALRTFECAARHGHFGRAAAELCVTDSAVSHQIRQLEAQLGVALFVRQPRGVAVSAEARVLYPQARRMVAEAEALSRLFRGRENRIALELGVEGDIADSQIETFLRMAHQGLPGLLLTLQEGCEGQGRLAVEEMCCEDELFLPLWEESYVMALPAAHPMAQPGKEQAWTPIEDWITCPQHDSHQRLMALYGRSPQAVAGLATARRARPQ